ncbi:MAG: hypothetical protein H7246_09325 [Phycisphaerae bacterium]|nr:hypothetical protein [Saprospiraceae bacterium]
MSNSLHLKIKGIFLPLHTTFSQASSVRKEGESIWCEAWRAEVSGLGEGCPRTYVTGEDVESGLHWLSEKLSILEAVCTSLDALESWMLANRAELDRHPAAFCAIETALLDLFAKEKNGSVEKLLGLGGPQGIYTYTGVLGDSNEEKFIALAQRYVAAGINDFKIKVNGDLNRDRKKLVILQQICNEKGISNMRIRFDANNLWTENTNAAIEFLSNLEHPIFGIEEPIEPKNYGELSRISNALDLPIILDESLCSLADLEKLDEVSGRFIANLKVSRLGGVIRSLEMIKALKKRGYPIIVGAHVGETSILTRAGMCISSAVGENLVAHEGGFGLLILEKEPVAPSLMFGAFGRINLAQPYQIKTADKVIEVPVEHWDSGWGLKHSQ